jgi:hypothetical protein
MATLMPLSGANCHMYLSHHGRVVMLFEKKSAYLIISAMVWGSIPHVAFCFWLAKVPSHKVLAESSWSPWGESLRDYMWTPWKVPWLWGLYQESSRTPYKVLEDSMEAGRTSVILGLVPMNSLGTPCKLLGTLWELLGDSLATCGSV